MICPHCKNNSPEQHLRCKHCDQKLFDNHSIDELWDMYKYRNIEGSFLELVYRAFNSTELEKDLAWERIYQVVLANIEKYVNTCCRKWTWLLFKDIWTVKEIVQEVFDAKIIPYINKLKIKKMTFESDSLKSFIKFINECTRTRIIELYRELQPKPKDIEYLCRRILKKEKIYEQCLKEVIDSFCDPQKYSEILDQRGIRSEGKHKRLFYQEEYYLILKQSIYDGMSPQKIIGLLDLDKFKEKYKLQKALKTQLKNKIFKLKREAFIELYSTILSFKKGDCFESLRKYFLDKLIPIIVSLTEIENAEQNKNNNVNDNEC